jgi:hypothetical protein
MCFMEPHDLFCKIDQTLSQEFWLEDFHSAPQAQQLCAHRNK